MTDPIAARATAAVRAATAKSQTTAGRRGASFAEVHAAAVSDSNDKATAKKAATVRGERTEKVEGHAYAEIVSGPRNGMFLNQSGNARDGQAFVMVKRDGREFHIYGTGSDRTVFEVGRERAGRTGTSPTAGTKLTTG
jgi:hypothetical protein